MPYKRDVQFLEDEFVVKVTGDRTMRVRGAYSGRDESGRRRKVRFRTEDIEPTPDGWRVEYAKVEDIDGVVYDDHKLDEVIQNETWSDKTSAYPAVNDLIRQYMNSEDIQFVENEYRVEVTGERTIRVHGAFFGNGVKKPKVQFTSCEFRATPAGWEKADQSDDKPTIDSVDGRPRSHD
jgi:hypothetical protein